MTNTPRVTYKDIIAFREKIFDELTEIRQENTKEFTAIREDVADIKIDMGVHREAVKGLLRRDTIGYVWDSLTTLAAALAISLGVRR